MRHDGIFKRATEYVYAEVKKFIEERGISIDRAGWYKIDSLIYGKYSSAISDLVSILEEIDVRYGEDLAWSMLRTPKQEEQND